jgi:hypothetical protein
LSSKTPFKSGCALLEIPYTPILAERKSSPAKPATLVQSKGAVWETPFSSAIAATTRKVRRADDLIRAFGAENVFMDVADIRPGVDFRTAIEDNVAHCGVLMAMVGPTWVSIANAAGERRLDNPNDFVALEIASALKRNVPVIPVLVHGARMPSAGQLPDSLEGFSYRNSVELTHARWNSDVALLVEALTAYVTPDQATVQDPVHATVPVQLPAPHPTAEVSTVATGNSIRSLIVGAAVIVLLAIAIGLYFFLRPEPAPTPATTSVAAAAPSAPAAAPSLAGTWKEPDARKGNSLGLLVISGSGTTLTMHAFGECQTNSCDWGQQSATFDGQTATATFTPPDPAGRSGTARSAVVSVHMTGNNLDVAVQNTFKDGSDSRNNQAHRVFVSAQ